MAGGGGPAAAAATLQGGERGFRGATGHRPRRYDDLELFFVAGADFDEAHALVECGYFTEKKIDGRTRWGIRYLAVPNNRFEREKQGGGSLI